MVSLASLLITCAFATTAPQQIDGVAGDTFTSLTSDISVARVRAALDGPPSKLTLAQRKPDFRVDIRERQLFQDLWSTPPWKLDSAPPPRAAFAAAPPWSQPIMQVDLLAIAMSVAHRIGEVRRAHTETAAREEVRRAIAEYCAAQSAAAARQDTASCPASR